MQTSEFVVPTRRRTEFVPCSRQISEAISNKGWQDGILTIYVPHTTAGVTINENADPDVARDMESYFDRLVPQENGFRHAEGNSDAHIKASLVGTSQQVIVTDGRLNLGTWQGVYFCEFDGPRQRRVLLAFAGNNVAPEIEPQN
jgi:secondary thiamine-phosphate synthase enzyme